MCLHHAELASPPEVRQNKQKVTRKRLVESGEICSSLGKGLKC